MPKAVDHSEVPFSLGRALPRARHGICLSRGGAGIAALIFLACSGGDSTPGIPELPVLSLSEEPTLQIGVLEGDPDYLFQQITSTLRLPSGRIAVSDAGASEVSVFGPDGTFVRRWGGRGGGPGEFRALSRIYSGGDGSILALDAWAGRVSVFDTLGGFSHQVAASDLSLDTLFPLDVWLYGRFWVDGALEDGDRQAVRDALDALPSPPAGEHRLVRVGRDGRLWIREPGVTPEGLRSWTVVTRDGVPEAIAFVPLRFDPQEISRTSVMGRWLGPNDVNFVRSYAVTTTATSAPPPGWYHRPRMDDVAHEPDEEEFLARVREAIMRLAGAQEIYYAGHATYSPLVDSLSWERPDDVGVDIVSADSRGWAGVFTHPGLGRLCGLGYGASVPPGWPNGGIVCGPAASPSPRED